MKEYELYLPVTFNDGTAIDAQIFDEIGRLLLDQFGGVTFFPQRNEGRWRVGQVEFRDEIVIYRVLAEDVRRARQFFKRLKKRLMIDLMQEEILITEKDSNAL